MAYKHLTANHPSPAMSGSALLNVKLPNLNINFKLCKTSVSAFYVFLNLQVITHGIATKSYMNSPLYYTFCTDVYVL